MKRPAVYIIFFSLAFFSAIFAYEFLSAAQYDSHNVFSVGPITFNLEYTINKGVNFGIAKSETKYSQSLLAILALTGTALVSIWSFQKPNTWHLSFAALFSGGGISNAYERVMFGGVFDYLNVGFLLFPNPFSFNLADVFIFLGLIGLTLSKDSTKS